MATLLTFHLGSFVGGTPATEFNSGWYGRSRGFEVYNCDYPLGRLRRQAIWIRTVAAMVTPPVYAYGDSAGGALATRLATLGAVEAAAGYSPVPDVYAFFNGPNSAARLRRTVDGDVQAYCDDLSPALHAPTPKPILVKAGADDVIVPVSSLTAWDATDPGVTVDVVDGPHLGGGPIYGEAVYKQNMHAAIDWLAEQAGLV